mmetsp:Transcript_90974/g.257640  ORF Transcript_90974/g.257640 Transcript_90974/m.257640 type:complete len:232 (-) Transcript_90974:140-835(-)
MCGVDRHPGAAAGGAGGPGAATPPPRTRLPRRRRDTGGGPRRGRRQQHVHRGGGLLVGGGAADTLAEAGVAAHGADDPATLRCRRMRHQRRPRLRGQRLLGQRPLRGHRGVGRRLGQRGPPPGLAAGAVAGAGTRGLRRLLRPRGLRLGPRRRLQRDREPRLGRAPRPAGAGLARRRAADARTAPVLCGGLQDRREALHLRWLGQHALARPDRRAAGPVCDALGAAACIVR